jgi:drug/metabolite transporter (DMT)-like permease
VPDWSEWKAAALVGAFLFLGAHGTLAWGQTRVPSGVAALVMATIPVWMVLIDWLGAKGERPAAGVWLGLACGVAGLAALANPGGLRADGVSLAAFLVLATSAPSWAAGSILAREQPKRRPVTMVTGMQLICGGVLLLIAAWVAGEVASFDPTGVSARSLAALVYTIVFGSVIGLTAYIWLLSQVSAARAGTYAFVNPLIAVVMGWAFAGEIITVRVIVAAGLILVAVGLIAASRGRRTRDA